MANKTIVLTSGTTWVVPNDFTSSNTIACIGGGSGGRQNGGGGGAGGAYAQISNLLLTPGASITIGIGAGGAGGAPGAAGGDTFFNATSLANAVTNGPTISCAAQGSTSGGTTAPGGGVAGTAASSVGTLKNNGGNGGTTDNTNGGGGGGAGGPNGAGVAGTNFQVGGAPGGAGDNGSGGAGGSTSGAPNGSAGTEVLASGSGSGGGGFAQASSNNLTGGAGGNYGAGGGSGGGAGSGVGGAGSQGVIIINYTPRAAIFSSFDPPQMPIGIVGVRNLRNHLAQLADFRSFVFFPPAVGPPTPANLGNFSPFDVPPKPPHRAVDAISFSGNYTVVAQPTTFAYSPFLPPPKPPHLARDWIAFSGAFLVEAFPQIEVIFSAFTPPPPPPHLARAWIAYEPQFIIQNTVPPYLTTFLDFSPGMHAKLWSRTGQQPQWWPGYFKAQFFPRRDRHDGGLRRRHPPVYSDEYYESLRERMPQEPRRRRERQVPNFIIPIKGLVLPVAMPTLLALPPYPPVPTLATMPPPFRMATPEEMDMDDEFIIRLLLEE